MLGVWLSLTRQDLGLGDVPIFSTLDDEVKWIDVLKMSNAARGVSWMKILMRNLEAKCRNGRPILQVRDW
jgi:hypothetical protein